jgi:translation elongation factor EF-1beta
MYAVYMGEVPIVFGIYRMDILIIICHIMQEYISNKVNKLRTIQGVTQEELAEGVVEKPEMPERLERLR